MVDGREVHQGQGRERIGREGQAGQALHPDAAGGRLAGPRPELAGQVSGQPTVGRMHQQHEQPGQQRGAIGQKLGRDFVERKRDGPVIWQAGDIRPKLDE